MMDLEGSFDLYASVACGRFNYSWLKSSPESFSTGDVSNDLQGYEVTTV